MQYELVRAHIGRSLKGRRFVVRTHARRLPNPELVYDENDFDVYPRRLAGGEWEVELGLSNGWTQHYGTFRSRQQALEWGERHARELKSTRRGA